jgi:hypothetical protein
LKLPSSLFANPEDAAKKPEDVLDFVPGECWVRLLTLSVDDEDVFAFENLLAVLVSFVSWQDLKISVDRIFVKIGNKT